MRCRICNSQAGRDFLVKEMMFGLGEEHEYFECSNCGCLQLKSIPLDMSAYYPDDYFSLAQHIKEKKNSVVEFLSSRRLRYELGLGGLSGRFLASFSRPLSYSGWIKSIGGDTATRVLDVGCGRGKLLLKMAQGGMSNLIGIDPYLEEDVAYDNGVKIYSYSLANCPEDWHRSFDLIMLHHSFEHMEQPVERLKEAKLLLKPEGMILVRIPVADSYAWRHYRENWFQIDAPRHIYLHTSESMKLVCRNAGLKINRVESVGELGQFTCSELYSRGIPMIKAKKKGGDFGRSELRKFRQRTRDLNRQGEGDQSIFFLGL